MLESNNPENEQEERPTIMPPVFELWSLKCFGFYDDVTVLGGFSHQKIVMCFELNTQKQPDGKEQE